MRDVEYNQNLVDRAKYIKELLGDEVSGNGSELAESTMISALRKDDMRKLKLGLKVGHYSYRQ